MENGALIKMLAIVKCNFCNTIEYVSLDACIVGAEILCGNTECERFFACYKPLKVYVSKSLKRNSPTNFS